MARKTPAELKLKFENGDRPTASDFINLIDTFSTKEELAGQGGSTINYVNNTFVNNDKKGFEVATLDTNRRVEQQANTAVYATTSDSANTANSATTAVTAGAATNYIDGANTYNIKNEFDNKQDALDYVPEDEAKKKASISETLPNTNSTDYPTITAVINYVSSKVSAAIKLQGDWNASTNTPDLTLISDIGTEGYAWRVSADGTTNLGGIILWEIGDLAVKTATGWTKIGNELIEISFAALTGNVEDNAALVAKFDLYVLKTSISTDNTLGGLTPSDEVISSQKAIKDYIDGEIEDSSPVLTSALTPNTYTGVPLNVAIPIGTPLETILRNLLVTYIPPSFSSFNVERTVNSVASTATYYEVGTTITVGNATFGKVNDSLGNPPSDIKIYGTGYLIDTIRPTSPTVADAVVKTFTPTTISTNTWTIYGNDANNVERNRSFNTYNKHRMYFGASPTLLTSVSTALDVQNVVNTLLDGILISSRTTNQVGTVNSVTLTCTSASDDLANYTYIAYVSSLGDITEIIRGGAFPVLSTWTRVGVWTITSRSGGGLTSIPLSIVVYKSNNTKAYQAGTTLNIR